MLVVESASSLTVRLLFMPTVCPRSTPPEDRAVAAAFLVGLQRAAARGRPGRLEGGRFVRGISTFRKIDTNRQNRASLLVDTRIRCATISNGVCPRWSAGNRGDTRFESCPI